MGIAILNLTPELFINFCLASKDGPPRRFRVKENPLPEDAKVVHVGQSLLAPYLVQLYVSSETFAEVPLGEEPPALPTVVYETVFDPN